MKTKKEQRVAIAKDVIASLNARTITPRHIYYFLNHEECRVCALGACLVGMLHVNNEPLVKSTEAVDTIKDRLPTVFSRKQLILIEAAYERYGRATGLFYRNPHDVPSEKQAERALRFGMKRKGDDEKLMRDIMENIIRNEGQFKP